MKSGALGSDGGEAGRKSEDGEQSVDTLAVGAGLDVSGAKERGGEVRSFCP